MKGNLNAVKSPWPSGIIIPYDWKDKVKDIDITE
jgi:hypothetical protein